jgi:hypothetical protein
MTNQSDSIIIKSFINEFMDDIFIWSSCITIDIHFLLHRVPY